MSKFLGSSCLRDLGRGVIFYGGFGVGNSAWIVLMRSGLMGSLKMVFFGDASVVPFASSRTSTSSTSRPVSGFCSCKPSKMRPSATSASSSGKELGCGFPSMREKGKKKKKKRKKK